MPYKSVVSRTDAAALIPEDASAEILKGVAETNPLMRLARRLPNMSRAQRRLPVTSALATAYFVSGDTGLKQTTEVNWANKYIDAEEIAAIVPVPSAVLDDADFDIWAEVKPQIVEAMSLAITAAVFYGTNIPASWTTDLGAAGIVAGSTAAGHTLSLAAYADIYEALLGETAAGVDGVYMSVEGDGFMVNGNIAHPSVKGMLRNLRDSNGNPIFKSSVQGPASYELDGTPLYFPTDGSVVAGSSLLIAGQWDQLVWAMRQDMTYSIATEGVITDAGGNIVYNLFQQDMVALRAVMRLGFALPNPINRQNANPATRFPFAVLTA
jgi:HK97 family phage major capsid protein